jgi:SAM-dependent methyltransferase
MTRQTYFSTIEKLSGERELKRLRHQMEYLYNTVDFKGKTVLDIGGGTGYHALYASKCGAKSCIIIEPESDGGHDAMIKKFEIMRKEMGVSNVELLQTTIQDYQIPERGFDIVLIHNAINHFDEAACITLRTSDKSKAIYREVFKSIAKLVNSGGLLLVSDCSSNNLYPKLGLKNPIDPSIEWHKHQPPAEWAKLAAQEGLMLQTVRWTSPTRFGKWGQMLFGNAVGAWFFTSHFLATFRLR